jgi:hypothetical protein
MGNALTKMTRRDASDASVHDDGPEIAITLSANSDHDDHFLMDTSDDPTYYHDKYESLHDGSRRKGKGNREKQCNTCGDWIDLGNVETGESALTNHERGRRCLAKVASTQRALELSATAASLEDLQHSGNISPRTPAHHNQFRVYSALYVLFSTTLFIPGTSQYTHAFLCAERH